MCMRGKGNYKNILLILIGVFLVSFLIPVVSVATSEDIREIDDTIDNQNNTLYEMIMDNKKHGSNDMEEMLKESDRKNAQGSQNINLSNIGRAIEINSVKLSLWARKYIVPFTIVIILFNVFMLATTGVKNYKNRKKYIFGSVFLYVFFLIVLNFPLYLLWRYSLGFESPFSFQGFYVFVEGLTDFLKEQSFVISLIVMSYGLVNYIGSVSNLPKRLASLYAIKASVLMFILFQIMPLILKLAV